MMIKLKYFFAGIIALCIISCSKEYSNESGLYNSGGNSSGTAVFKLSGAPDSCTGAIVNGTYTVGVALNDSNTVVISLYVDTPGTFAITTGTINGMSFDASGVFNNTGTQTVTLHGSGKPSTAGTTIFAPGKNSCTFAIVLSNSSTGGGGTTSGDYLTCGIAGVSTAFDSSLTAKSSNLSGLATISIDGIDSLSKAEFTITLNNLNAISAGAYNLLSISSPSSTFCTVSYVDNTGSWGGAASSQSGTFQVVVTSITSTRIEGTFSGTLYDNSGTGSNTKAITSGKFSTAIH